MPSGKRSEAGLLARVRRIGGEDQGGAEEDLLALALADRVLGPVLRGVAGVPLEAGRLGQAGVEISHAASICVAYTARKPGRPADGVR